MVEIYNEQVRDLLSNDIGEKRYGLLKIYFLSVIISFFVLLFV